MTAAVLEQGGARRTLPVPVAVALLDGRRMLLHPLMIAGAGLFALLTFVERDEGPRAAFEVITIGPTFFHGVFAFFAANLVASRDRRAHSGELLAATPAPRTDRVGGLCLATLVPAAASLAFVLAVDAWNTARDAYVVAPTIWHLTQGPLTVLGGALLGVMVARLTSVPGVPLLVMAAMVAANFWLNNRPATLQPLGTFVPWPVWVDGGGWAGVHPGSPAWHVVYLTALCAMAATGAFLRETTNRVRVLVIGAGWTALAAVAGAVQLP